MKTSDFMNEVTVESLQKDLRSKYGVSVDIAKYSKTQLESYSQKIQNKLKEFETKHKFNESLKNDEYQKTLLIGKIVESAINQYLDNPLEVADDEDLGEDVMNVEADDVDVARDFAEANPNDDIDDDPSAETDVDPNMEKNVQQDSKVLTALRAVMDSPDKANLARMAIEKILQGKPLNKQQIDGFRDAMQSMMEPFLNMQGVQRLKAMKRGMGAESIGEDAYTQMPADMKEKVIAMYAKMLGGDVKKAEMLLKKALSPAGQTAIKQKFGVGESVIKEGAEEQAELTMAAKDMVDRFTAFLEDVAEMGAEGMLELADSIRDELGQEQADNFVNTVKPALEQTQEVLTSSREALTAGVGIITGETAPTDTIGAEPEGDIEEPMDTDEPVEPIEPTDDEFGASEPATGGEEEAGREKRESYTPKKKSIAESTRIMNKLAR